ncbi:MAG: hypothetical protein LRY44_00150 [Candidatus Pacebacteria bacterium]|nr:hypothetical protein [Candidatus Paceibacterota bacterium]MCD8563426.1 hypothetical protein [Candidatus Paceibacterota bacterium]
MGLAWYEFTDHMESIYTYPQTMLMGFMYVILLFMITFFSFGYETEEDTLSGHCKKK